MEVTIKKDDGTTIVYRGSVYHIEEWVEFIDVTDGCGRYVSKPKGLFNLDLNMKVSEKARYKSED